MVTSALIKKCLYCGKQFRRKVYFDQHLCCDCIGKFKGKEIPLSEINKIYNNRDKIILERDNSPSPDVMEYFLIHVRKRDNIIELGCGSGKFGLRLFNSGYKNIILVDFNHFTLKEIKRNNPGISVVVANVENLPFKDKKIKNIFSFQLIEHLFGIEKHFIEVGRVLKDKGIYYFSTPNKYWDIIYFKFLKRIKDIFLLHPNSMSYLKVKRLTMQNGFKIKFINYNPSKSELGKIPNWLGIGIRNFCIKVIYNKYMPYSLKPNFYCIAKKE